MMSSFDELTRMMQRSKELGNGFHERISFALNGAPMSPFPGMSYSTCESVIQPDMEDGSYNEEDGQYEEDNCIVLA